MSGLIRDLLFAVRSFRRRPFLAASAILTLAIGFGASTAIVSLFSTTVFRLPFRDPSRLLRICDSRRREDGESSLAAVSQRNFFAIRERARSFESVVAGTYRNVSLRTEGGGERFAGIGVSEGWLPALGVRPVLGRGFTREEERAGSASRSVLVSYGIWKTVLGGARDLSARRLNLDGASFDVIGVLPRGDRFPWESDLWFPWTFDRDNGREHNAMVLGRLKPGVPARDAARDLRAIGEELAHEFPDSNRGFFFIPVPIADDLVADRGLLLEELGGAVTLFLLIACTNVASLLLARSLSRRREFAVRRALGATTGREIRSAVAESLALTVPAAGLGILLSYASRAFLVLLLPDGIASAVPGAAPGASEAAAALAVSLAVAVVLGLLTTVRQPGGEMILSSGRSPGGDRRGQRALRALVVGEMAIALVLLCAAATLVENFIRLQRADLGFQSARLLTATVAVPPGRPFGPGEKSRLEKDLTRRIEGLPGVASVTAGDHVPLMVSNSSAAFAIDGRIADPVEQLVANYREIATGYFETLAIPVLRGRTFDARDHADAQPVCIVSRSMARRFFPRGDAIGKRLRRTRADEPAPWRTIVGIVDDVREPRLAGGIREALYVPADQSVTRDSSWDFRQVLLAIRTPASPGAAAASVRAAIDRYDPTLTVYDVQTGDQMRDFTFAPQRTSSRLLLFFAAFSLILASSGTYSVLSYVLGRNRSEIGIRAALGASPRRTLREQLARGGRLVVAGLALGAVISTALSPFLSRIASDAQSSGVLRTGAMALILAVAGALACYLPARRAARIDPAEVLRGE